MNEGRRCCVAGCPAPARFTYRSESVSPRAAGPLVEEGAFCSPEHAPAELTLSRHLLSQPRFTVLAYTIGGFSITVERLPATWGAPKWRAATPTPTPSTLVVLPWMHEHAGEYLDSNGVSAWLLARAAARHFGADEEEGAPERYLAWARFAARRYAAARQQHQQEEEHP